MKSRCKNSEPTVTPRETIKSKRSHNTTTPSHPHQHALTMLLLFALFVAATLGTQVIAMTALVFLIREASWYVRERCAQTHAEPAQAWSNWL